MATKAGKNASGFEKSEHLFCIWTGNLHLTVAKIIPPRLMVTSLGRRTHKS